MLTVKDQVVSYYANKKLQQSAGGRPTDLAQLNASRNLAVGQEDLVRQRDGLQARIQAHEAAIVQDREKTQELDLTLQMTASHQEEILQDPFLRQLLELDELAPKLLYAYEGSQRTPIALSDSGELAVVNGKKVQIFDETKPASKFELALKDQARAVAFCPDSQLLAVVATGSKAYIRIHDWKNDKNLGAFELNALGGKSKTFPIEVRFSSDGQGLLFKATTMQRFIIRREEGERIVLIPTRETLPPITKDDFGFIIGPEPNTIVHANYAAITQFNVATERTVRRETFPSAIRPLALTKKWIIAGGIMGDFAILDPASLDLVAMPRIYQSSDIRAIVPSPPNDFPRGTMLASYNWVEPRSSSSRFEVHRLEPRGSWVLPTPEELDKGSGI